MQQLLRIDVDMSTGAAKISLFLAVLILLIAYVKRDCPQHDLKRILEGLIRTEESAKVDIGLRVAVGFGSCVDLIVPAISLLEKVNAKIPDEIGQYHPINNAEEFQQMFVYYYQHGAASEHFITNETLFKAYVQAAKSEKNAKIFVGGNAPVMVKHFQKLGFKVLLGAQMSEHLRTLIGDDVEIAGNHVEEDDIHLILEYGKGSKWGPYTAPRANRFIIHNDQNNPMLTSLEKFSDRVSSFRPHLVVVGGLQMLDNFPYVGDQRRNRLNKLSNILNSLDKDTHIHFEMAHFAEEECLEDIIDTVLYHADSVGMNEQELPNLLGLLMNGSMTQVSDITPRIATTLDQMRLLLGLLADRADKMDRRLSDGKGQTPLRKRKLTRIHVHTLAFQAIMTKSGSTWKNSKQAAAKAALTANRHTCGNQQVEVDTSRLIMDKSFSVAQKEGSVRITMNPEEPVACWKEGDLDICLAPVIVCTKVVQTVGGGDNISSSGLVVQI